MNPLRNFYNMKTGIIDLSRPSAVTVPLDPELIRKYIGGVAMNREFLSQNEDALIFGTGPLTGSFAPASSLLTATFTSPIFKHICHVPFTLHTGPAMKFSGIDFLIVKGAARELSVIYVNRGKVQIHPAGNLRSLPAEETMENLKRDFLPLHSSLVTGPAADHGIPHTSVSMESYGSLDKAGMASVMAARNLKGIVLSGTGGIPFESENPDQGKELIQKISTDKNFKNRGFAAVLKLIDGGKDAETILGKPKKKDIACYHCPSPCMTHVISTRENLSLLLLDHIGFVALAKKTGIHALPLLQKCLQFGFDPTYVARRLPDRGTLNELFFTLENLLTVSEQNQTDAIQSFTGTAQIKNHALFGGGIAPIPPWETWDRRVVLAMVLGICPLFLLRFPGISETDLLSFILRDETSLAELKENLMASMNILLNGEDKNQ